MDKLIAYQVLGLDSNASTEEVKEAYARLSKEYHPEENPEEFQQLHEAYVTLTRGGRRGNRAFVTDASTIEKHTTPEIKESDLVFHSIKSSEVEKREEPQEKPQEQPLVFRNIKNQQEETEEQEEQPKYDFDASIQQAQQQEEEQFKQNIQKCVYELEILFSPPNYNELKKFKEFFGRKEYENVFFSRPFIYYLAQYINQVELKYEVYSYFIKFYGLKNKKADELIPEAQQLYRVIDSRYSITQDVIAARRRGMFGGAFGGVLYAFIKFGPKILKNIENGNEFDIFVFIPFIVIGLGCYILYKIFCKKHNIYEAMKKTAGWIFVLNIPVLVFDLWAPFSPNPSNSATLAVITLVLSAMWWLTMKLVLFILKKKREKNDQK